MTGTRACCSPTRRDLSEAGNAITALLAAPERSRQIGEAAHARVQHHFLGPHHLGRYFEVIRRLIAQRPLPEHLRTPDDGGSRRRSAGERRRLSPARARSRSTIA